MVGELSEIGNSSIDKSIYDIKLKKCTSVFDNKGNFTPEYDETVTDNIFGNEIIICIGQEADVESMDDEIKQSVFSNGLINVNKDTLETNIKGFLPEVI